MSRNHYAMAIKRPVSYGWTRALRPIPPVESQKAKELAREYGVKVD